MAAGEDQPEPVVGDVIGLDRVGGDVILDEQRQRPPQGRLAPEYVERPVAGDRGQPGARPVGDAIRPRHQGFGERVLDALLCQVQVVRDAHRRGEDEAPLAPVRRVHDVLDQSNTITGRTSRPPPGEGMSLAMAIASSRSAASMT